MSNIENRITGEISDNAKFAKEFLAAAYGESVQPPEIWAQVLNVVGEAGEFAEAFRRYSGNARRSGSLEEMLAELADIVISSYVMAERLGVDLDKRIEDKRSIIMTRGFKETSVSQ